MRLHIDTDLGGDTDDACALAMVLGWPDTQVVGVTTTADPDGQRAGYVMHLLELAGRDDIPVVAGAGVSLSTGELMGGIADHDQYWGSPVKPRPAPPGAAIELLDHNIDLGATIVAIGPFTNLAFLEATRPGRLDDASIVLMGGWVDPPADGLPMWGPEMDWNVQSDVQAALTVAGQGRVTLSTLPATMKAQLRAADLPRLAASGPLGRILARQAEAHASEFEMREMGRTYPGLPVDLLNFQYDSVACAVALDWSGVTIEEMALRPILEEGVLRFEPSDDGRPSRVVVDIDGSAFAETWITRVEAAQAGR
jgi:purine nucleosidase